MYIIFGFKRKRYKQKLNKRPKNNNSDCSHVNVQQSGKKRNQRKKVAPVVPFNGPETVLFL